MMFLYCILWLAILIIRSDQNETILNGQISELRRRSKYEVTPTAITREILPEMSHDRRVRIFFFTSSRNG